MKLVLSPAFSLLPFSLLPHLLPGPLALVLLGHSAFVLAVLSTCTLMLLSGQLHQLPRVFLQISLLLLCFIYIYFCLFVCFTEVFLSGSDGKKKKKKICLQFKRTGFYPWVRKIPWRREWQPTLQFCLENSMDRGALRATVYGVTKSQTRLSD